MHAMTEFVRVKSGTSGDKKYYRSITLLFRNLDS